MSSDRLTGLDASFLHLEDAASHMHVAGVMIFEGEPPAYDDLIEVYRVAIPNGTPAARVFRSSAESMSSAIRSPNGRR